MTTTDRAKSLYALIAKLKARRPVGPRGEAAPALASQIEAKPMDPDRLACPIERCFHGDGVLREFVRSYLMWETTAAKAEAALSRIAASVVDINELRVCLPDEIGALLGGGYSKVDERVQRLKASLGDIYKREHCLRLSHLREKPKRDARAYLEQISSVPAFVSARTALVALEAHAFPLDQRMYAKLEDAAVLDGERTVEEAAAWLERTLKAGEALEAFSLIQSWADAPSAKSPAKKAAKVTKKKGNPAGAGRPKRPARPARSRKKG
jgi:hypothetical protein